MRLKKLPVNGDAIEPALLDGAILLAGAMALPPAPPPGVGELSANRFPALASASVTVCENAARLRVVHRRTVDMFFISVTFG